jgi:hypothetical protein
VQHYRWRHSRRIKLTVDQYSGRSQPSRLPRSLILLQEGRRVGLPLGRIFRASPFRNDLLAAPERVPVAMLN